jgi:hypothetical protein
MESIKYRRDNVIKSGVNIKYNQKEINILI